MALYNEVTAVRGASTFKDLRSITAFEKQRSIRPIDHQCLLPSPALPGAGSTVGTSEVPSQPGLSELPCVESRAILLSRRVQPGAPTSIASSK